MNLQNVDVVVGGVALVLLALGLLVRRWRRTAEKRASKNAHEAAQARDAPVDIGETYEFGITEFTDHHSGERVAVGKVQGFVIFTHDVPRSASEGDVIMATVTSFNRGNTSADATYDGNA